MGYTSDLPVRNYYNTTGGNCGLNNVQRSRSNNLYSDNSIQMIQLANNNLYCVFTQYTGGLDNTYQLQAAYSSNNGISWTYVAISKPSNSAYNHYNPYVFQAPNGCVYVVCSATYSSSTAYTRIIYYTSINNGGSFPSNYTVLYTNSESLYHYTPTLTCDSSSNLYFAF